MDMAECWKSLQHPYNQVTHENYTLRKNMIKKMLDGSSWSSDMIWKIQDNI